MLLSVPTRNHPALERLQPLLDKTIPCKTEFVFGVASKIMGRHWTLVPVESSHAKVFSYAFKKQVQLQDAELTNGNEVLVLQGNNYLLISKSKEETNIESEDIGRLLGQLQQESKVGMSYILNGLSREELAEKLKLFPEECSEPKESPAQKIVKEYFNKGFRGRQLYSVPKYLPDTGNWSDTQKVQIKIKEALQ